MKIYLEEIEERKIKFISENLKIPKSTIYRWMNMEKIDKYIKFIKMWKQLGIDIDKIIEIYEKKSPKN